ncbi:hypothetical protein HO173_003192 [Letharia columbiana]|uniref:Uncharacterized protein n=1 Tax=Letharia columbiana TaxID=112416 RepID=A0A8H6G1C5_9LECA|nr:uncharacterized protein HO173_003192 [Letharia columbiana]KAF6238686.1 hypothetical protein HO173_003192 [Letharia columbiana]
MPPVHQPGPPVGPPTPSEPVLNPYTVQLQFARQELEPEQADENHMLRDRDELARIQNEVNEIRTRRQSAAPTIHQPVPQAPMPPAHQPFLFAPPPQPSPVPLQAPQPTLALPQQRTPTPSETEAVPRRSFLHQGNDPMIAPLLLRFKAVDLKYIKQIYHGTFDVKHLNKLSHSFINRLAGGDEETKGLKELLRCFEVYSQIICFFTHKTVALPLQKALSDYRYYISDLSTTYTFQSVRHFHEIFVYGRIQLCQNDAHA